MITITLASLILFGSALAASAFEARSSRRADTEKASRVEVRGGTHGVPTPRSDPPADYYRAKWLHARANWRYMEHKRNQWRAMAKRLRAASKAGAEDRISSPATPWYVTKQIRAGNVLGRESSGDPWPNCPDPWDGSGSWQDTVNCENGGSWLDSPGYYRCGLQFDPRWERRFGRLCP